MDRRHEQDRLAVRLWCAADSLDALHGTEDRVWWWTHEKVAELGRDPDPDEVRQLVGILERRLEHDRAERRRQAS